MVWKKYKGRQRKVCPNCHYVHWSNEKISVGGLVARDKQILLVQRAQRPGKGLWTIPGGFVEQEETMQEAIKREIKEETGVIAEPQRIVSTAEIPEKKCHEIYVTFALAFVSGDVVIQHSEILEAHFFTLTQAMDLPLADLTRQLLTNNSANHLSPLGIKPELANGFYLYG
ncbi:NUDIX domain-containing protein [Limosilactobacillus sp. STM2_1]|uniref:NUDIX domain-containing protein n=1 Tax=Limosilactobacillus rudii TaxID=2759755 RepID=A0A7W3UMW9_9LACO|nr:NUDIX domain-containing protein [Limosilactobacillus rudii]MBB1098482.1 NUDIX domain-containing protein [Limosilactobacillus rudii]MCD7135490.1 NUDIX domain-containing protein [Limosilactobacillus rudii]